MEKLLRRAEVEDLVGLATTSVYRLMRAGSFPEPVRVGARAVRWRAADLDEWLASRPLSHGDGIRRAS